MNEPLSAAWFGLAGGRERILTEIAEILTLTGNPISPQDVYAVLKTALQKLRASNRAAAIAAIVGEPQWPPPFLPPASSSP